MSDLGTKIDELYALRALRLDLQKKVDACKAEETVMRSNILDLLQEAGLAKASGLMATCGIKHTKEPVVEDWDKVWDYITKTGSFELVQKRISAPAWRELLEAEMLVPGTSAAMVTDLSLTKSTR